MSFKSMVGTLDLETRGLTGPIVVGAIHVGADGRTAEADWVTEGTCFFETAEQLRELFATIQPRILYIHNLEFDLRKLIKHWKIRVDWRGGHLVVAGKVVRIQLRDYDIELRDSLAMLPGKLRDLVMDFGVGIKGFMPDMDDAEPGDPRLLDYLRGDVEQLYKLVERVYEMSGLSLDQFLKATTAAGLSLRMFEAMETDHATRYLHAPGSRISPKLDEVLRRAYLGGRCEVFKLWTGEAWHYDCNSLYPSVMHDDEYPIDAPTESGFPQQDFDSYLVSGQGFGIARANVITPDDIRLPLLGIRNDDGKHIYPVGKFAGWWTFMELAEAVRIGYQVYVQEAWVSWRGGRIFHRFVEHWAEVKHRSYGGKREFAKLVLNGLAGKFGQGRKLFSYREYRDDASVDGAVADGSFVADTELLGTRLLVQEREAYGYFLRVDIAIHIVAAARIRLYHMMELIHLSGGEVAYCDTDSIVSSIQIPECYCDQNQLGYWKLERKVVRGIYLAPKFYAEQEQSQAISRARGVVGSWRRQLTFARFETWLSAIVSGETAIQLYGRGDGVASFPGLLSALNRGIDLDAMIERTFTLRFLNDKRRFDLTTGDSVPVRIG